LGGGRARRGVSILLGAEGARPRPGGLSAGCHRPGVAEALLEQSSSTEARRAGLREPESHREEPPAELRERQKKRRKGAYGAPSDFTTFRSCRRGEKNPEEGNDLSRLKKRRVDAGVPDFWRGAVHTITSKCAFPAFDILPRTTENEQIPGELFLYSLFHFPADFVIFLSVFIS